MDLLSRRGIPSRILRPARANPTVNRPFSPGRFRQGSKKETKRNVNTSTKNGLPVERPRDRQFGRIGAGLLMKATLCAMTVAFFASILAMLVD